MGWRIWHPVGTCRLGPETDPDTVVDSNGCVHGFTNLFVADASVMPTIPRANTHLPVLAVAERIAEVSDAAEAEFAQEPGWLVGRVRPGRACQHRPARSLPPWGEAVASPIWAVRSLGQLINDIADGERLDDPGSKPRTGSHRRTLPQPKDNTGFDPTTALPHSITMCGRRG